MIVQYVKNLNLDDFDETIFLNEKNVSNSPSKFTPFSKQGVKNQLKNHFAAAYNFKQEKNNSNISNKLNNPHLTCQRILNYEAKTENENVSVNVNHNISQMVNK